MGYSKWSGEPGVVIVYVGPAWPDGFGGKTMAIDTAL